MRLLSVALAATTCAVLSACGGEPETTVPNVVPGYVADAVATLSGAGLAVAIEDVPPIAGADGSVNGYAVDAQEPAPGARVPQGSTVRLRVAISVNAGPGGLGAGGVVPDLMGMEVNQAIGAANRVGLLVTVIPPPGEVEALVVRAQSLAGGSRVAPGAEVSLTLG